MDKTSERHGAALGRVLELAILLNEDMTRGLGREGLTVPRAHLLWALQARGPSTQRALATDLGTSPRNVTGLVDGLVDSGFVTRQPHPTDRRATLVSFTARGARVAEDFERGRAHLAEQLFAGMPERRFDCLVEGLDDLLARLKRALAAEAGA